MKPRKLLFSIIFIFSTTALLSQNQLDTSLLTGNWHLDFQNTFSNIDNDNRSRLTGIPEQERVRFESYYANRDYAFYENGTYQLDYNNGTKYNAFWEVTNGSIIKISDSQNNIEFYKVINLTNSSLILEVQPRGSSKILVKKLYLTKI